MRVDQKKRTGIESKKIRVSQSLSLANLYRLIMGYTELDIIYIVRKIAPLLI